MCTISVGDTAIALSARLGHFLALLLQPRLGILVFCHAMDETERRRMMKGYHGV